MGHNIMCADGRPMSYFNTPRLILGKTGDVPNLFGSL
jgi:hypothetical protein